VLSVNTCIIYVSCRVNVLTASVFTSVGQVRRVFQIGLKGRQKLFAHSLITYDFRCRFHGNDQPVSVYCESGKIRFF
jgi:hypothetical protein